MTQKTCFASIINKRCQILVSHSVSKLNDLHVLSFLSSLLHRVGPKYRRECLPNETVLNLGKRKSEFLKFIF